MKLFELEFVKNSLMKRNSNKKFSNLAFTLHVYLDLCYFRGWKGIRMFYSKTKQNFFILAINPQKSKRFEIFFPYRSNFKINILNFSELFQFFTPKKKKKYLKFINIAFVEQDSTVTYYRIISNYNKTSGPIGN